MEIEWLWDIEYWEIFVIGSMRVGDVGDVIDVLWFGLGFNIFFLLVYKGI